MDTKDYVIGINVAVNIYDTIQHFRLRNHNKKLMKQIEQDAKLIRYLANMIDEHNVPISKFDAIAITNIARS